MKTTTKKSYMGFARQSSLDTPCHVFVAAVVGLQGMWQGVSFPITKGYIMGTREILESAKEHLYALRGEVFDVLTITQPTSVDEIRNLAKIVSKLSPLIGNLIEFKITEFLNSKLNSDDGKWKRQDPGFPDVIFDGNLTPAPGFEIKAWFPFATEITGRFKDSEERFKNDEVDLVILAWLPEHIFWGKPRIIDVCVVSGKSVAIARDLHYHKPPHYLVIEPENTSDRTANLQQTNTNGYVIQDSSEAGLKAAKAIVKSWGKNGACYSTSKLYQDRLKGLMGKVEYRLDTNYAKIDRIEHKGIEEFKRTVLGRELGGETIKSWGSIITDLPPDVAKSLLNIQ
ncbi:MAG: hypothetical protein ACI4RD_10115 [Kiritimatiellia bacterium]